MPRLLAQLPLLALLALGACGEGRAPADLDSALLLALSVFPLGPDGKAAKEPGAATLLILRREGGRWLAERLEDPESNVFHKAVPFAPAAGPPGILTIGAEAARLKLWRRGDGGWSAQTLWAPEFGGKRDRLRDLELADFDGDGHPEIALATHDQGVVALVEVRDGEARVRELDRRADTFVHEVEVGDVDGDGALELYTTPSQPNRLDGTPQRGRVMRYRPGVDPGVQVFADLGERHAKEVLLADLDGDGAPEVYVSVEGRVERGRLVEPVEIRRYRADGSGEVVATLEDRLCRFLVAADVEGDGVRELVAAPFRSGLWLLRPRAGEWARSLIDADSSGFEHAAAALDLDGDGRDELYVAADDQHEVRRYVWSGDGFEREVVYRVPPDLHGFTWNVTAAPLALLR